MLKKTQIPLLIGPLVCLLVGVLGSICTRNASSGWYELLKKPSINPPDWVFGPVWTILYALMGIALGIVYNKREHKNAPKAMYAFGIQLFLNYMWSVLFFCKRSVFGSLIEIILLIGAIVFTTLLFWKISKKSALLLLPYLLWTSFAAVLNFQIWQLNK
jgi:tryptophan-rich sensory protein